MIRCVLICFTICGLLVPAHGANCFGATFETSQSSFEYKAFLRDTDCDLSNTSVTPLYMLGACCKSQMNNFGPHPPHCGPGDWNIMNASSSTCQEVFAEGSPDVRQVQEGRPFDRGEICSDGIYGVIFVQTDCSSLNASSVVLEQRPGGDNYCWSGHTLSRGALAAIVLGCVFGVALLAGTPVAICWWRWRKQRRRDLQVLQSEKEQEPVPLQIVKVSDSVFLSKQDARKSSIYASHLLEQPGGHAYDIELETQGSAGTLESIEPKGSVDRI